MLDKNALMQMLESIRDERGAKANTARRIGNAFLSLLDYATTTADGKLSSIHDDVAQGVITFIKGLVSTGLAKLDSVQSGNLDKEKELGYSIEKEENGKYHGYVNDLTVWGNGVFKNQEVTGLAHFFELVIDKIKSAGGAALFTPADGFDIDLVEEIDGGYRLLWRCQDGDGNQRDNMWRKDDQALCMSFNQAKVGEQHNVSNKYYWALVTAVSDSAAPIEKDGEYYNYIEISSSDCDGTVNPEKGDSIVMLGYRGTDDKARQSAIYLSAYSSIDKGLTAPLFAQYRGINDFDLASHRTTYHDANGSKVVGQFEFESGESLESAKWYEITLDNETASYDPVEDKFTPDTFGSLHVIHHIGSKTNEEEFASVEHNLLGIIYHADGSLDYSQGCEDGTVDIVISANGDRRDVSKVKFCFYNFDVYSLANDNSQIFEELISNNGNPDGIVPDGKLYCSKDFCIIRGGEKGDTGTPGDPGSNGKGFVAAYKYSNSTPSKPTATKNETNLGGGWYNAVPTAAPQWNGWAYDSSAPSLPNDYNWVKSPSIGDSERTYFECVFKTTSDNQEVNFKIQSSSESRYDFIYVSDVDASDVPSKPSSGSQKGDNYISGQNAEILTITKTIAKAGEHHVFVCYAKDGSNGYGDDCGWFTIENISFTASSPNILWQSNGVLDGETITSWTDPFRVTGEDGEKGEDGENGKGALEIIVSPDVIVFDTNDQGVVPSDTYGTSYIQCYRDGSLANDISYGFLGTLNCTGNVQYDSTQKKATVTVSGVTAQSVSGTTVSNTTGWVKVLVRDNGTNPSTDHYVFVPFQVNVSKYTGKMLADNKTFQTQYTEISNKYKDLPLKTDDELTKYTSSIKQTAREISLKVSEQAVGRRNMLPGSAFRKQDEGISFTTAGYISLYDNYEGTNSYVGTIKAKGTYVGLRWCGSAKSQCIHVEKGKKYTISCWIKADSTNIPFVIEALYQASASDDSRPGGYAGPTNFSTTHGVSKVSEWELVTVTISVPVDAPYEWLEIYIFFRSNDDNAYYVAMSRPMMEEGEEYGGMWSLSEKDYDYVGGNLLDNTATFTNGSDDNVYLVNKVIENGYEDKYNVAYAKNENTNKYTEIVEWETSTGHLSLAYGNDYIFSFLAKGTGTINCYMYKDGTPLIYTDTKELSSRYLSDGSIEFKLEPTWRRYYVHWRIATTNLPTYVLMRAVRISEAWIAKPKLEIGCTMTDWTEKRTDMVDKQALLATGIDIKNKRITATADNFVVQNNSGGTTMTVDKDGNLCTNNAYIKGNINATGGTFNNASIESGTIGGMTISNNSIGTNTGNKKNSYLAPGYMNVYGERGSIRMSVEGGSNTRAVAVEIEDADYSNQVGFYSYIKGKSNTAAFYGSCAGGFAFYGASGDFLLENGTIHGLRLYSKVDAKASDYSLITKYEGVVVNTSTASGREYTLPSPSENMKGKVIFFTNKYGVTCTVKGKIWQRGEKTSVTVSTYETGVFICDGTHWIWRWYNC